MLRGGRIEGGLAPVGHGPPWGQLLLLLLTICCLPIASCMGTTVDLRGPAA